MTLYITILLVSIPQSLQDHDNDELFISMVDDTTQREVAIPAVYILGKNGWVLLTEEYICLDSPVILVELILSEFVNSTNILCKYVQILRRLRCLRMSANSDSLQLMTSFLFQAHDQKNTLPVENGQCLGEHSSEHQQNCSTPTESTALASLVET